MKHSLLAFTIVATLAACDNEYDTRSVFPPSYYVSSGGTAVQSVVGTDPATRPVPVVDVSVPNTPSAVAAESAPPDIPTAPGERVDYATIHGALDSFGTWQQDPTYGLIWFPSTEASGADFRPYASRGHWVETDAGWYWQSEYPWGWVVFHYGRWVQIQQQWAWVPGAMFAPSWVDWRSNDDYVGWAPLPPDGMDVDVPYVFCAYSALDLIDLVSQLIVGAAADGILGTTEAIPPTYGIGGAFYAWGPRVVRPARGTGVAQVVPIASVWHAEVLAPRAGVSIRGTVVATAQPVGSPSAAAPASAAMARPLPSPRAATGIGGVGATGTLRPESAAIVTGVNAAPTAQALSPVRPEPISVERVPANIQSPSIANPAMATRIEHAYSVQPAYRPSYAAPAPVYRSYMVPPSYSTASYHSYSAPAYHSYSAPAYHSYGGGSYHSYGGGSYHSYGGSSYHSSGGSFHASGGGFHFGGRR